MHTRMVLATADGDFYSNLWAGYKGKGASGKFWSRKFLLIKDRMKDHTWIKTSKLLQENYRRLHVCHKDM